MSAPPPPSPVVTRLEPLDRRGRRLRIHLDRGEPLEAALEVVERAGVGVGDPLDDGARAALVDRDLAWRARETALAYLAHRPRSRVETRRRLAREDLPARTVRTCLDALEDDGLLDDAAFARAFARDRLKLKPRGRSAVVRELRARGVAAATAEAAVDEVFADAGASEEELAVASALKWLRGQSPERRRELAAEPFSDEREAARRRLYGFLRRRGFRGAAVSRAMEAATDAAEGAPGPGGTAG